MRPGRFGRPIYRFVVSWLSWSIQWHSWSETPWGCAGGASGQGLGRPQTATTKLAPRHSLSGDGAGDPPPGLRGSPTQRSPVSTRLLDLPEVCPRIVREPTSGFSVAASRCRDDGAPRADRALAPPLFPRRRDRLNARATDAPAHWLWGTRTSPETSVKFPWPSSTRYLTVYTRPEPLPDRSARSRNTRSSVPKSASWMSFG